MKLAVIQRAPAFLDRDATLQQAVAAVAETAAAGAQLIVFPEAFVSGYPAWIWRLRPGGDMELSETLHTRLLDNAVDLRADHLAPLREAARAHGVMVVIGVNERDGELSRSTLYNTAVVIGADGKMLNAHRKLMPTNPERMVWGFGDGSTLRVLDTPLGRIGTLICWENYMPLARYALYAQGVEIYIALTYDCGDGWVGSLRHIAREGGCWVVGSGWAFQADDLPDDFPDKGRLYPDPAEWISGGDSVVVKPGGGLLAGPLRDERGILYAELDTAQVAVARRSLDVAGHYARPDVFQLRVDTRRQRPLELD